MKENRQTDPIPHPAAVLRERQKTIKFWAGLVIAASGLLTVFVFKEIYVGFSVALIGTGIVPFEKLNPFKK